MIYSKKLQKYVPIIVERAVLPRSVNNEVVDFYKYSIKVGRRYIGYVDLEDIPNGVHVSYIQNLAQDEFKGFGKIADQIEVEHCMHRGLSGFSVLSDAALNSHAVHYKRGKRFLPLTDENKAQRLQGVFRTSDVNEIVRRIIRNTPPGERYNTSFLSAIPMFMPRNLIRHYKKLIQKNPLLKGIL